MTPPDQTTPLARLPEHQVGAIHLLADAFRAAGERLYLVGGPVRDLLLEQPVPRDLDFATSALPERTAAICAGLPHTGLYDVGAKYGTIGVILPSADGPIAAEITTFRSEVYDPGSRFPDVAFGTTIEADLARRDATVNAMAIDLQTGEVIDPWYGQADLAMGVLRAVGDPDERFAEDPLRLLRIARFAAQLGFSVEPATLDAMTRQAPTLKTISRERVYAELTRLLCGTWADAGLDVLLDTGLLTIAMPELLPLERDALEGPGPQREKDLWHHTTRVVVQSPARPAVRWAALLHDAAKPLTRSVDERGDVHFIGHERVGADLAARLLRNLKADQATIKRVRRLVDMHLRCAGYDEATWTDSAVRRLALEAGDAMQDLLDLTAADVTSGRPDKQRAAARRVQGLRGHLARLEAEQALDALQSPLDGNALMTMFDRPPGRWIAIIKDALRERVIDGNLAPDDVEGATALAREMMARGDADGVPIP